METEGKVHKVGMGRHLVNDNFQVFDGGDFQMGDPSDICILLNAHRLCQAFCLPPIWELWTAVYPDDPMTKEAGTYILGEAQSVTAPCDPTIPDDRADILQDLRSISCDKLADLIVNLLKLKGLTV